MSTSPAATKTISAPERSAPAWLQSCAAFLIRRRILISAILFGLMIAQDVAYGPKPHDVFDFRDPVTVVGVLLVVGGLALRSWAGPRSVARFAAVLISAVWDIAWGKLPRRLPSKTYMIVQPRPDHSLRIPRPDLSARIGTPDACTLCHTDRSPRWAAEAVAKWYGPRRRQEPHFGEVFAAAREGKRDVMSRLMALVADKSQPAIVRASALDLLRGYGPRGLPTMVAATRDEDPPVRLAAVAGPARTPRRRTAGRAAIASRRAKLCSVVLETDCPRPGSDVLCAI